MTSPRAQIRNNHKILPTGLFLKQKLYLESNAALRNDED